MNFSSSLQSSQNNYCILPSLVSSLISQSAWTALQQVNCRTETERRVVPQESLWLCGRFVAAPPLYIHRASRPRSCPTSETCHAMEVQGEGGRRDGFHAVQTNFTLPRVARTRSQSEEKAAPDTTQPNRLGWTSFVIMLVAKRGVRGCRMQDPEPRAGGRRTRTYTTLLMGA